MSIQEKQQELQQPQVTISSDAMEAFLMLPTPPIQEETGEEEEYVFEDLKKLLDERGVVAGIDEKAINTMLQDKIYDRDVKIAQGEQPIDGVDGHYDYNFQNEPLKKPKIRTDGTVDYWSMNLIETVMEGQVIATYTPAVQGQPGYDVKGKAISEKRGKELAPLKGKGFERANDNLTYIASISGKIDMQNDRVMILPIYEIYGNVDLTVGNIDFVGDVVIHGNVCNGVSVKSTGTITIDGVVEAAQLSAGKDIILRSGMLGGNKATAYCKENMYAKFFEYTTVEVLGNIEADSFLNSEVKCLTQIIMKGKRAKIIGGHVYAAYGIEANDIGNDVETNTFVTVGIGKEEVTKLAQIKEKIKQNEKIIDKLERGLKQFEILEQERDTSYKNDPRRMQLLRERIKYTAITSADKSEAEKLDFLIRNASHASVKVIHDVYPGVTVKIGDLRMTVKEQQSNLEFINRVDHIVMCGVDEKIVI